MSNRKLFEIKYADLKYRHMNTAYKYFPYDNQLKRVKKFDTSIKYASSCVLYLL
jgi:hypothetical protein